MSCGFCEEPDQTGDLIYRRSGQAAVLRETEVGYGLRSGMYLNAAGMMIALTFPASKRSQNMS